MRQLPVTADSYFIDATDCSHTFVVRTSLPDDVVMQQATAEDDAIVLENESYYFNKALSFQNRFRYSEEEVSNSDLQTLSSFKKKNIYVMADPAVSSLSFEWLDQFGTSASLPAGSLYMVEGRTSTTPEIKILWPDDDIEIETGIKAVKSVETSAGSRRADTDAIYTLQGVRVSRTEKGRIYIRNGRKFIAQ